MASKGRCANWPMETWLKSHRRRRQPIRLAVLRENRARPLKIRHHLKTWRRKSQRAERVPRPRRGHRDPADEEGNTRPPGKAAALHRNKYADCDRHRDGQTSQHGGQTRLLSETGLKPDALLISTERYASGQDESVSQGVVSLDGSEGLSVQYAPCCQPIPGDRIVGYLGRGEGLVVHAEDCPTGKRLLLRDSERFLQVEWADEPVRPFDTTVVTVANGRACWPRMSAIAWRGRHHPWATNRPRRPPTSASLFRCATASCGRCSLAHDLGHQRFKP
jgi:(p)ppGpp synthase/HD superfamily hydrolase